MKKFLNRIRLIRYYMREKNCDFFDALEISGDFEMYLFNLDLFEKSVLK